MMSPRTDRRWGSVLLAVALGVFFGSAVLASETTARPMHFDHLALDDGLSQSNVLSILQDSDGLMWFGTENGLNKYNGYEFEYMKRERGNPDALSSDFIFDVDEDADGNLWIATNGGGLARLDRETGKIRTFRHDPEHDQSIASDIIRRVLVASDGIVWVGTRGAGLDRFDPQTELASHYDFSAADGDASNTIYALHQESAGELWVGGDHGLTRLDTESNESVTYSNDPTDVTTLGEHSVRAIESDTDGRLWVGSYGGGLSRLSETGQSFEHFLHAVDDATTISGNRVSSIFQDSDGRLWVGTNQGLNLVDPVTGTAVRYTPDSSDSSTLRDKNITTIYQDRSGLLWVGTQYHGLNKWNPRTWQFGLETAKNISASGDVQPVVMAFAEDNDGKLWIGTFGEGLNAVDRDSGEVTMYRKDSSGNLQIGDDRVMSLMYDSKGQIWAGTMSAGISLLNMEAGTSESFVHIADDPNSLSANGIMVMHEAQDGRVWVGTFGGGISIYDPQTGNFKRYKSDPSNPQSLSNNRVTSFAEDSNGNMWVGTDAGGLNLFDKKTEVFHRFRHRPDDPKTIASDKIYAVNVDAEGTVWVGTHGGGLDQVVGNAEQPSDIYFSNISQKDGLSNDVVYSVQFDDAGWIWSSTNYGISRYNPDTGEFNNMHRKDGLQSEEFNFGAHHQSKSGELFFGGPQGYNAFHPEDVRASTVVPLIAMTGFFSGGDRTKSDLPVDDNGDVEISWKEDIISFEFSALDFTAPERNQYMYKLEGFDRDWIDLGNRRRATYTDLDDGNYLFRVRAASSDGVWNEAGFALPLKVTAAPWDTWWAYLGYLALVVQSAVLLWNGHRRKMRREEEYSLRLEHEVNDRTEKLNDKNAQLRVLNDALQESSLSDPLTGLRNRRFVFEEVSRDLEVIRRRIEDDRNGVSKNVASDLVFMMIDLDHFKPINDTYGHAAGDQMLIELRDVLLDVCRRTDDVVRWGGDEFVVIAKQTKPQEAEALAERIRSSVAGKNFILEDGQIVRTTCSIGFAAFPLFKSLVDESSLDQIISLADGLMYEAKKKRDAWVGMLGPSEASTSFDLDADSIDSSSILFRARRAGKLKTYSEFSTADVIALPSKAAG